MIRGRPKKKRERRRILVHLRWLTGGLILLVLPVVLWDGYLYTKVRLRLHAIREAGLPANYAEVSAWRKPVPDSENAAIALHAYFEGWSPGAEVNMEEVPIVGGFEMDYELESWEPLPEYALIAAEAYLDDQAQLEDVHAALELPFYRLPRGEGPYWREYTDHLAGQRHIARNLALEIYATAERQHGEALAAALADAFRFYALISQEYGTLDCLVRVAVAGIFYDALKRGLSHCALADAQLAEVAGVLEGIDLQDSLRNTLIVERADEQDYWNYWKYREDHFDLSWEAVSQYVFIEAEWEDYGELVAQVYGQALIERLRYLDTMGAWIEEAGTPFDERMPLITEMEGNPYTGIGTMFYAESQLAGILQRDEAQLRMARAAVAIARYRARAGNAPESLEALVPTLLPAVPVNPYTGTAIGYVAPEAFAEIYEGRVDAPEAFAIFCTQNASQSSFLETRLQMVVFLPE